MASRDLQFLKATCQETGGFPGAPFTMTMIGTQTTESTNNNWYQWQRYIADDPSLRRFDIGGRFYTSKPFVTDRGAFVDVITRVTPSFPNGTYGYKGQTLPRGSSGLSPASFASLETDHIGSVDTGMLSAGSTAISRSSPTVPATSLLTSLGELYNEGLPSLIGSSFVGKRGNGGPLSGASDEFLNYQFGIKPFVSDLQKLGKATAGAERILDTLRKNSGKLVRRRYTFPTEKTTVSRTVQDAAYPYRLGNTYYWDQGGSLGTTVTEITKSVKTWFSGAFSYHFDTGDRAIDQIKAAEATINKLYGSVSASTAWNLLPWSWAADWFTNMGDVIANVDMFSRDGLALHHGYVMRTYRVERSCVATGIRFGGRVRPQGVRIDPLSFVYGVETKNRRQASPYGFGVTESSLSTRQKAIIGALGFSRTKL